MPINAQISNLFSINLVLERQSKMALSSYARNMRVNPNYLVIGEEKQPHHNYWLRHFQASLPKRIIEQFITPSFLNMPTFHKLPIVFQTLAYFCIPTKEHYSSQASAEWEPRLDLNAVGKLEVCLEIYLLIRPVHALGTSRKGFNCLIFLQFLSLKLKKMHVLISNPTSLITRVACDCI